jgi:probable phosphomutase (TIGR03848 family)
MITVLLIRHAEAEFPANTLAGRVGSVHLSAAGRQQAEHLASHLAALPVAAVYSSPLERAMETAQALAQKIGLNVKAAESFNELDYGEWTGRNYSDLRGDPAWTVFNRVRSLARIPSGESAIDVAARAIGEIERLRQAHPDQLIAVVTHADVIRTVIAWSLGMAIDLALRIEISPASVSIIRFDASGPRILLVNGFDLTRIPV